MVEASQMRKGAIGQPLPEIAGPVEARLRPAKGIGDKALQGQLWSLQVASGHAGAPNQDLTGYADRHRPQGLIDNVDRGVCHRLADRDRIVGAPHRTGRRPYACLRGAYMLWMSPR